MNNTSKILLISFFLVVAIIAVGSYMFINRDKSSDTPASFPIPIPTLNQSVETTTSKIVPTKISIFSFTTQYLCFYR